MLIAIGFSSPVSASPLLERDAWKAHFRLGQETDSFLDVGLLNTDIGGISYNNFGIDGAFQWAGITLSGRYFYAPRSLADSLGNQFERTTVEIEPSLGYEWHILPEVFSLFPAISYFYSRSANSNLQNLSPNFYLHSEQSFSGIGLHLGFNYQWQDPLLLHLKLGYYPFLPVSRDATVLFPDNLNLFEIGAGVHYDLTRYMTLSLSYQTRFFKGHTAQENFARYEYKLGLGLAFKPFGLAHVLQQPTPETHPIVPYDSVSVDEIGH